MGVVFVWMYGGPAESLAISPATFRPADSGPGRPTATREELESLFSGLGIDCSQVGFYNQPAFHVAERNSPSLFQRYAEYVEARPYDAAYLARARRIVPQIAAWLRAELAKGGREGACVDCSFALSKILDKVGLWNYVTAGSVTVEFDPQTRLNTHHWPHMLGDGEAVGHAWLTAPPFRVIDLTIAQQKNTERIRSRLPAMIVAEACEGVAEVSLDDMLHPDLQLRILSMYGALPTIHQVMDRKPEIANVLRTFPPFAVRLPPVRAKYFPCCMTALEEPFESICSPCFSGRSLSALLEEMAGQIELGL
jgi:hypothetical protein